MWTYENMSKHLVSAVADLLRPGRASLAGGLRRSLTIHHFRYNPVMKWKM